MYSVRNVDGKGLGCIANQKIKRGTLIEKEEPVLKAPPGLREKVTSTTIGDLLTGKFGNNNFYQQHANAQMIIDNFKKMKKNCKEDYLKLNNKWKMMDQKIQGMDELNMNEKMNFKTLDLGEIDLETAMEVCQIYSTNAFHNGVFLKMSRFNHSCVANAEYFWNDKDHVQEIRSISNIAEGEEITIRYHGQEVLDTETRRNILTKYHFTCTCPACDLSEEELIEEKKLCHKMKELKDAHEEFIKCLETLFFRDKSTELQIRRGVGRLKEMYRIAKKHKTMAVGRILSEIVKPGIETAYWGYIEAKHFNLPVIKMYKDDMHNFASVGFKLSAMLYGKDNGETMAWQRKKEDPIKYYKKLKENIL